MRATITLSTAEKKEEPKKGNKPKSKREKKQKSNLTGKKKPQSRQSACSRLFIQ